jgi:hypothetical protein
MQSHQGGKGGGKGMGSIGQQPQYAAPEDQMNVPMTQDLRQSYPTQQTQQFSGGKGASGNFPNPNQLTPDGGNTSFGGNMTSSLVSNQPQMGQPNSYPNTTGSWDNSSNQQPAAMPHMGGKGKGA